MINSSEGRGQKAEGKGTIKCSHPLNSSVSALIVTLLLISILTGLVVDFVYDVHIDTSSLANWSNAQKASLIAKSGQNLSTLYLDDIKNEKYTDQRDFEMPVGQYMGASIDLTIKIEDENSKFNINLVISPNGTTEETELSSLKKLLEYLNINPDLSLVIADWIDPDIEPRLADSEYNAKNAYLWSVDELKLIEGIDNKTFDRLSPYITVFSESETLNIININTADIPVLVCLNENMTESLAKNIIEYRKDSPFEYNSDVLQVSGMKTVGMTIQGRTKSKSSYFRITTTSNVNGITRIIESVMDTSREIHFWREG